MQATLTPSLEIGDEVIECGGTIAGTIVARGTHAGEWILRTRSGAQVTCLDVNLAKRIRNSLASDRKDPPRPNR